MESELLIVARQQDRSCTFEVEGSRDNFFVVRFDGSEGVSSLFEFHLEVVARHVAVAELVGKYATLKIVGTAEPRLVHGLILRAEYAGEFQPRSLYHITLVPDIYKLLLRSDCRIFQQKATPDILKQVLDDVGIKRGWYRIEVSGLAARDYCVQYRETDLHFISRLMEEDGLFYYFEHARNKHVLVITDRAGSTPPSTSEIELPFHTAGGMARDQEHVRVFRLSQELRPTAVTLRDFNLHRPDMKLEGQHETEGALKLYDYPGEFQEVAHGQQLARHGLEAEQVSRRVGRGHGDSPRLTPGFGFTLSGHPRGEFDGEYRVLRVHHTGEQPDTIDHTAEHTLVYSNEFACIPTSVPYRPPRVTPRPAVRGVQTATVVGPASEEIHVDEHGRVKVQFHWDRLGKSDESSSCWVRVSQGWAGNGFGMMFIPRVGHEVIVDFIEGDPDRPIITGRVYHGLNATPYKLPDEKTKSTIKSETYQGGGFNELRFEDAKKAEQVFLHAQRDLDLCVRNDRRDTVGHDEHQKVVNDRMAEVGRDEHRTVKQHAMTKIGGNEHTEVIGTSATKIGGATSVSVGGKTDIEVKAATAVAVTGDVDLKITGAHHLEATGEHHVKAGSKAVLDAGGQISIKSAATVVVEGSTIVLKATSGITLQVGASFITVDSSGVSIDGTMIKLASGGAALAGSADSATAPAAAAPTAPEAPVAPTPAEKAPG